MRTADTMFPRSKPLDLIAGFFTGHSNIPQKKTNIQGKPYTSKQVNMAAAG